jgi:hypothetical protein
MSFEKHWKEYLQLMNRVTKKIHKENPVWLKEGSQLYELIRIIAELFYVNGRGDGYREYRDELHE